MIKFQPGGAASVRSDPCFGERRQNHDWRQRPPRRGTTTRFPTCRLWPKNCGGTSSRPSIPPVVDTPAVLFPNWKSSFPYISTSCGTTPITRSGPTGTRFVLSKGHASPGFYAVLARAGFFPKEELATYRQLNSRIQGHAHPMTPGVEMNSGSLGMGLSFALGCALAARLDGKDYSVYALLGDGECDEGEIWEAAMSAAHHKATNLVAIVDRNRIQNDPLHRRGDDPRPAGQEMGRLRVARLSDRRARLERLA